MRPARLKKQVSSGGVVFRKNGEAVEVVLVSVKGGRSWCLPKGLVDEGETAEETALREVREETGLTCRVVAPLGDISYWYYLSGENVKCRKTVSFFLMEYLEGDTSNHDEEVDAAEWMLISTAHDLLSFRGDREVLERAMKKLDIEHAEA